MDCVSLSPILDAYLGAVPPGLLFHYTSAEGMIGILRSKEIWATNIAFLNDSTELRHAAEVAKIVIEELMRKLGESSGSFELLKAMHAAAGTAAARFYVFSLSEERDMLSQWRGYCPPPGGYSIGFPALHLRRAGAAQGFMLGKCLYSDVEQYDSIQEMVFGHEQRFRELSESGTESSAAKEQVAWQFGQHLARFGAFMKHGSFAEENEWRLVSDVIDESKGKVDYRSTTRGVTPFVHVSLQTESDPSIVSADGQSLTVVVGPNDNYPASQWAAQFLLTSLLGEGWRLGRSDCPYRAR